MISVRRVHPAEYVEAGEITASAWSPREPIETAEWIGFHDRVADVAGRDAVAPVFVAVIEGKIVGSVTLELESRVTDQANPALLGSDEAHVRLLAVAPEARRRGVATALMAHCVATARREGKARLTLNTSAHNAGAQSFYQAIGFQRRNDEVPADGSALVSYELDVGPVVDS